jgi:carbon storage regulator CsrA
MLVVSRQRDESLMIGEWIQVTVIDIRGDKARIGVIAPRCVPVHRKEILEDLRLQYKLAQTGLANPQPRPTVSANAAGPAGPTLVLTRRRDESVMIGDDVEVTVIDIRGDKVRLGVNSPRGMAVYRKEVFEAIHRENAQAAEPMRFIDRA